MTEEENILIRRKKEISEKAMEIQKKDLKFEEEKQKLLNEIKEKDKSLNSLSLESTYLEKTLERETLEYENMNKQGKLYSEENFKFKVTFIETLDEYDDGLICFTGEENAPYLNESNKKLKERKQQLEALIEESKSFFKEINNEEEKIQKSM